MGTTFPIIATGQAAPSARTSTAAGSAIVVGEEIPVLAADLTLNGVLGHLRVPKGAEILWVMLDATDLDANGAPTITLSIGDTGDDDRLLAANTIAQSGAAVVGPTIAKTGFGYQYDAETLITVKVKAAPATAAAGTIKYAISYVSP